MSSLSATTSFSSVSGGLNRKMPLADDALIRDAESVEGSSQAIGLLSRESAEPALSFVRLYGFKLEVGG